MTHPDIIARIFSGWTDYQRKTSETHTCNCKGPQNGQPLCPCQMQGVQIIDGRYVRVTDIGPAPSASQAYSREYSEFARLMGDESRG